MVRNLLRLKAYGDYFGTYSEKLEREVLARFGPQRRAQQLVAQADREQPAGTVLVTTLYGGSRIVDMLVGDPLPRIC